MLLFTVIIFNNTFLSNKNKNGYEGDLIPLRKEIANMAGYEKATQLILKNWSRINHEIHNPADSLCEVNSSLIKNGIIDSIRHIQEDKLKLRFTSGGLENQDIFIEGKDTTIRFMPSAGDYYMRGNNKDKEAHYTFFKHEIFYTTRPVKLYKIADNEDDTPRAIIKIKDRYYYRISSSLDY